MLSVRALKNIQIGDFEEFFTLMNTKGRSTRIKAGSTVEKYSKIKQIIEEEIASDEGSFSVEQIDAFIFEQLFFANMNYHYLYKFDNLFADESTELEVVNKYLKESESLFFNRPLAEIIDFEDDKVILCTTRIEATNTSLGAVHLLLKIDSIPLYYGITNVFAAVTIDVERKLILIKFNYKQFEEIRIEPSKLIIKLKSMLTLNLRDLELNITTFMEAEHRELIYNLYRELTAEADEILSKRIDQEKVAKIPKFLIELGLEPKKEYIEQIKVVIYQETFKTLGDEAYKQGWVFRFHYREGDHTRATSANEKRLPVYSTKTYWQLKELINEGQEMYEAGFHWYIGETDEKERFTDVRFESKGDTIILHYYYRDRQGRKEKEDFVLRKISKYLS